MEKIVRLLAPFTCLILSQCRVKNMSLLCSKRVIGSYFVNRKVTHRLFVGIKNIVRLFNFNNTRIRLRNKYRKKRIGFRHKKSFWCVPCFTNVRLVHILNRLYVYFIQLSLTKVKKRNETSCSCSLLFFFTCSSHPFLKAKFFGTQWLIKWKKSKGRINRMQYNYPIQNQSKQTNKARHTWSSYINWRKEVNEKNLVERFFLLTRGYARLHITYNNEHHVHHAPVSIIWHWLLI